MRGVYVAFVSRERRPVAAHTVGGAPQPFAKIKKALILIFLVLFTFFKGLSVLMKESEGVTAQT